MKKILKKNSELNEEDRPIKISRSLLLMLPLCCVHAVLDNDFWFQINHGRYLLKNWGSSFVTVEPFTIHKGLEFSFEKWLTCISFYKIYDWFGGYGMYILMLILAAILTAALYKLCSFVSGNKTIAAAIITVSLFPFMLAFMRTRPQIIAYILLCIELIVLEKYAKEKNSKILIALPFLSLIYIQFHSTMWPVFFIFMLPYIFEFKKLAVKGTYAEGYKKLPIIISFALSFAAGFINPYGYKTVFYMAKSGMNEINSYIQDLTYSDWTTLKYFAPVLFLHLIFFFLKEREDIPLRFVFFNVGTFIMSLFAIRNSAYYILTGIMTASWMFKDKRDLSKVLARSLVLVIGILVVGGSVLIGLTAKDLPDTINSQTSGKTAVDYLAAYVDEKGETKEDLKIYTGFDEGSYAEWMGFKCYIDPRGEIFLKSVNKKEDIFDEFVSFHFKGITTFNDLQDKYNFDYWVLSKSTHGIGYIRENNNFKVLYEDDEYLILKPI